MINGKKIAAAAGGGVAELRVPARLCGVVAGASHPSSRTTLCRGVRPRPTMQHDEVIWQVINQNFCSFKIKYENQMIASAALPLIRGCPLSATHPVVVTRQFSPARRIIVEQNSKTELLQE
jgi:hypothetical protein